MKSLPRSDANAIDTGQFGLAKHFYTPQKSRLPGNWEVRFDTGIVLFIPPALFDNLVFHLEESDPKPPART